MTETSITFGVESAALVFGAVFLCLAAYFWRQSKKLQQRLIEQDEQFSSERSRASKAEEALLKQTAFFEQVIDLDPNFIFAKDREGRFTLVNKAVADAYGTTAADLIGKTDADFNPNAEEVVHFRRDDLRVMDRMTELIIPEEVITDAAGKRRWLRTVKRPIMGDSGVATQVLGVSNDITIHKEAAQIHARFAAMVEASDDAILSTCEDGIIESWNRGAEAVFGYTASEMIGRPVYLLSPPELREEVREIIEKVRAGIPLVQYETKRLRKDEELIDVSLTVSPIVVKKEGSEEVVGFSAIARDKTKKKETERELALYRESLEEMVEQRSAELRASQQQLRQKERLASIGALAAGIAHEINNPVGAILLAAQNAIECKDQVTPTLLQDTCQRIISNARRCSQIVKGVLKFSKKEELKRVKCDINPIIEAASELVREAPDIRSGSISLQLSDTPASILASPVEIEQVLVNLLSNALQAGEDKVNVVVRSKSRDEKVIVEVSDDGCGIAQENLKHIFDPFYTTRVNKGGTGLGLSVVHGIVSGYGGKIDVESQEDVGTTVRITLPAENLSSQKLPAEISTAESHSRGTHGENTFS